MSTTTTEIDTKHLHPEMDRLIRYAVMGGWRATQAKGSKGVRLIAPDPNNTVQIRVPNSKQVNQTTIKSLFAKVIRYMEPEKRAALALQLEGAREYIETGHTTVESESAVAIAVGIGERKVTVAAPPKPAPHVVSERPWLAKRNTGTDRAMTYPSQTTVERTWSDGATDYRCVKTDCSFSDPIPQRVARHYSNSKDHPSVTPPTRSDMIAADPYVPGRKQSKQSRIERLARELAAVGVGAEKLSAEQVAERLITLRDEHKVDDEVERAPRTPEQVLELIRRLVDDGTYLATMRKQAEQEDALALAIEENEQLRILMEQAEASYAKAIEKAVTEVTDKTKVAIEKAQAEAARWRRDLVTLAEMLNASIVEVIEEPSNG